MRTMMVCQDLVDSIAGEIIKSKKILSESLMPITQTTLSIFTVYVQDTECIEKIMAYFLAMFQSLRVQMGVSFTEKAINTFINVFSR